MSAGGTLEVWYQLTGPVPAGDYGIYVGGYQSSHDAQLHADVIFRPKQGAAKTIVSADSTVPVGSDLGVAGDIDATVHGEAIPTVASGDLLVLRVHMVSGTAGYIELGTGLTIP
jgi:hypothetical protein